VFAEDALSADRLRARLRMQGADDDTRPMYVAFAPDGKTVVTATFGKDRTARLWDAATGKEIRRFETEDLDMGVESIAISPDGKTLATGCRLDRVFLWNLGTGKQSLGIRSDCGMGVSVAFSPDGKTLAFGGLREKRIHLFDIASGKEIRGFDTDLQHRDNLAFVESIAFAPDGKTLISGGSSLIWWDVSSGRAFRHLPHNYGIHSVAFSPDGKTFAAGSWDGTVQVYAAGTGKELMAMRGHRGKVLGVFGVAFSPDGRAVASAGEDGTVRLWEFLSGKERLCLNGHEKAATAVCFAPDGKGLVSGSVDGSAILWDVALSCIGKAKPRRDDPKEWQDWWDRLGADDAREAHRAMCEFARSPTAAVRFFKERIRPTRPGDVGRLIGQLDSDHFDERESASAALEKLGAAASDPLRQVLAGQPSAEVRRRAERLLQKLDTAEARAGPATPRGATIGRIGHAVATEALVVLNGLELTW